MTDMRRLVLGTDESGRSCVVESSIPRLQEIAGLAGTAIARLWSIDESPPAPVVKGLGRYRSDVMAPGHVNWSVIDHAPLDEGNERPRPKDMHYRDVIDFLLVMSGSGQLILGDGDHQVGEGDCIVMAGTEHAFHPDAGGCRLMGFAIGTLPPVS
jgi:mannose-6-phosphate isomerase-like protein (cupin superfamily)